MLEIIAKLNVVDYIIIFIILRLCYVGWRLGTGKQIVPLVLLAATVVLSFHYYAKMGYAWISVFGVPLAISNFISFTLIVVITMLTTFFINKAWLNMTKTQGDLPFVEKVVGAIMGFIRATIVCGILSTGLVLAPVGVIQDSARQKSLLSGFFINSDITLYCAVINAFPANKEKESVESVLARLSEKKDYELELSGPKSAKPASTKTP